VNIDNHIQKLSWRFAGGTFTPNQKDVDAVNGIVQWVNDQRRITINQNHLFAKLYIYYFNQYLDKHQANVFDKIPQIELSKLLKTDIDLFYQSFTNSLNNNSDYHIFKDNGITDKHPNFRTEEEAAEDTLKIKNMSKSDISKIKKGVWELEDVKNELNKLVTEALNRFQ